MYWNHLADFGSYFKGGNRFPDNILVMCHKEKEAKWKHLNAELFPDSGPGVIITCL